ncbi:MAG: hypothetical protein ACI4L8_04340, partial [Candidatus Fimadaptatus sp.]
HAERRTAGGLLTARLHRDYTTRRRERQHKWAQRESVQVRRAALSPACPAARGIGILAKQSGEQQKGAQRDTTTLNAEPQARS